MPGRDLTRAIIDETRSLERARRICAMLREERALGRTPYAVAYLAERLLKSLSLR